MVDINKIVGTLSSIADTNNEGTETALIGGVLYIKGSDDIQDWLINFSTIDRSIHTGFLVESTVIFMKYRKEKISMVVGHSAGGAIACLVGMALGVPAITLGSPRFFKDKKDSKIYAYCYGNTTHYRLKRDPVCYLPFWFIKTPGREKTLPNDRIFGHFLKDYIRNLNRW